MGLRSHLSTLHRPCRLSPHLPPPLQLASNTLRSQPPSPRLQTQPQHEQRVDPPHLATIHSPVIPTEREWQGMSRANRTRKSLCPACAAGLGGRPGRRRLFEPLHERHSSIGVRCRALSPRDRDLHARLPAGLPKAASDSASRGAL